MAKIYLYTLLSVFTVSFVSFIGIFSLAIKPERLKKLTLFFVSLSAGALLGGAALHLIPEMVEKNKNNIIIWLVLLAGIMFFFILEKFIRWRHCHIPTSTSHPHPVGIMNLVGDAFHNLIDGMVIAGSFLVSPVLGFSTSLAVIVHEIPQEIGDFGVLIHAGYSRRRALVLNFITALTAILGALLALLIGPRIENFSALILPFTAGGFIYIATADLIPELNKEVNLRKSALQLFTVIIGIGLMWLLKQFGTV